jgi:phosphatidylglycerol:prolipoprotein diacylglycerol transferase
MKQTLIDFPHEIAGLPLFGLGWLLIGWILWCLVWGAYEWKRGTLRREFMQYLPVLATVTLLVTVVMPWLEPRDPTGQPMGMAIRGYGLLFMLGIVSGVGLAVIRARKMGINPDVILSLALVMVVSGLVGARFFYVLQYWSVDFAPAGEPFQPLAVLGRVLKFTEGGLVVYGSLIGAIVSTLIFLSVHKLPRLATLDLVVPSMLIGLALGRLGCLMNGCCYGGVCSNESLGIQFPAGSPAYIAQLDNGQLLGITVGSTRKVTAVKAGSLADQAGLRPGDRLEDIQFDDKRVSLLAQTAEQGPRSLNWDRAQLPDRSLPVYPSQILSSLNALILCFFLCVIYPYRRRDGQVTALLLIFYALTRFLLEIVRTDEAHQFLGALTPAQLVGIPMFLVGVALLVVTSLGSKPLALPNPASLANRSG